MRWPLVYYQPIVHLNTRRIVSSEALLRWQHPEQGLISPYKFLEAAEDTGLLIAIGQWLVMEACHQLHDWQSRKVMVEPLNITVNISARQFADAGLAGVVQSALRQTGIDGSRLQLELTENVAARDPRQTATILSYFKHLGVNTIIDNFGAGHCSLMSLTGFPVDEIKIDRSLVGEMLADRRILDVVDLIVTIAHKLKFKTMAEGIETSKQLENLRELRCEIGQGYLFSPPREARAAEQFLHEQRQLV